MKINLRWLIQAVAFVGCIYFFLQVWGLSKEYIFEAETKALVFIFLNGALFLICFFVMALTSYLKQKFNSTLKNKIAFFEKLIARMDIKPGKAEE